MISVVEILEATTGGTRRHLRDLVLGLDPVEFRVRIIASPRRDPAFVAVDVPRYANRNVAVDLIPMRRRPAPVSDMAALLRISAILRRVRPDIVHAHSSKAGFLGRLAAHACRVPRILYSPHGFSFEMDIRPPLRAAYRRLESMAGRWTNTCLCVCEQERRAALSLGVYAPDQVTVIPNGVDLPDPAADTHSRKPILPPVTVGFVGRLCAQKGPDLLADAAPEIARAIPDVMFRVIGDGPLRETVRRRFLRGGPALRWSLEPGVDDETARERATEFDVLVMPSRWEGLPYVLLDALAAGIPVAAAAVGGMPEWVPDDAGGKLFAPRNPQALAAAVIELLQRQPPTRSHRRISPQIRDNDRSTMIRRIAALYRNDVAR